ncbi:MAG: hypothetical protein M3290_13460, partial [Actinomycetota bacterium]|nr:hypothetical protein [Actinomycetota bacterium]
MMWGDGFGDVCCADGFGLGLRECCGRGDELRVAVGAIDAGAIAEPPVLGNGDADGECFRWCLLWV